MWSSEFSKIYNRDSNPRTSIVKYINECDELSICYSQEKPWGLGFTTELGNILIESFKIVEVLIDSTFKTNNEGLELFVLIALSMGTGFPVSYFLLEPGTEGELITRVESLTGYILSVKSKYRNLNPTFFLTDKESSQIYAIEKTFGLKPSLCLWHIKRAL